MALNAAQIAKRAGKLTASRMACLMVGDAPKIVQLYNEFIGEALPEDLSDVWPVRLGELTEPLNLEWFERKHNMRVSRQGEVINHPFLSWAACTLDGWVDEMGCALECKHCAGREPVETLLDRYFPQVQWICEVTGADQVAMSIILGASPPIVEFVPRDVDYAAEMIRRGKQFMDCVQRRIPPVVLEPAPLPVDATKVYDFSNDEKWMRYAAAWVQTIGAAETAKEAEKILKAHVPADAK